MAKVFRPIGLTRDQLAEFLSNPEQIKQFENLFALAETVVDSPDDILVVNIAAGTAQSTANDALSQISEIDQELELLAVAPVRNNVELSHDVNGILPYANQTARVRSNQVLTWLSM
jgi:uncharacterized NAD-dependent epimerase/dehydratase family protein